MLGPHPFHAVGEKYITAVLPQPAALPLLIPVAGRGAGPDGLLGELDGLLFTGSPSNVEPQRYGGEPSRPARCTTRSATPPRCALIPRAIAAGVPVLGVCRGFQEMNVAFGGTLWQHVHEVPGHRDASRGHRRSRSMCSTRPRMRDAGRRVACLQRIAGSGRASW